MRPLKKLSKATGAAHEFPALYQALPEAALVVAGDEHATFWDESPREWGRRGYGQLPAIRRAYRRDRYYGTW